MILKYCEATPSLCTLRFTLCIFSFCYERKLISKGSVILDTLISNVTLVTMNEKMDILFGAYLGIKEGKIAYIGKSAPTEPPKTIIDGTGMVAIPGLVNAHAHLATSVLRNFPDDATKTEALQQLLDGHLT